ncbi:MAG: DUF3037 domain-containing protein [Bryobacterales bacterium]|nr:DUF3037 domain-containing protein [Bryobacterales bacterium]
MCPAKGYYSIIQYCPDPSRLEAVNVGVALFCPEMRWLKARFGRRKTRIRQLFGAQDWEFVALQQTAIEARSLKEGRAFERLEDFEAYISRRANALTLTAPRSVKVEDPEAELEHLLQRLVGAGERTAPRVPSPARELGSKLQQAGAAPMLRDVVVRPPNLPRPIKAPYAYQNGRLNLIEPMQLEGETPMAVFRRVSVRAVEGGLLADYTDPQYGKVGLVVVAKFGPAQQQEQETAATVFERHNVPMYTFDELEPLIEDMRQHAD